MKTVYTTDEGVKMNSNLDFGSTTDILNEFDYLMDTTETMWDIQCRYSYRITDDHYIQLAHAYNDDILDLKIIAQYKLRYENLKENILFIIKNNIEAHLFFNGFPKLENSAIFTPAEFDEIITRMRNSNDSVINDAKKLETSFINYLRTQHLNPYPTGNTKYSWHATCPQSTGNHKIMVSTKTDTWGCGYCRKKGKQVDLDNWLVTLKKNRV